MIEGGSSGEGSSLIKKIWWGRYPHPLLGGQMAKWHEEIAKLLGSKHSDTQALVRAGKKGAKKRSSRLSRRKARRELNG